MKKILAAVLALTLLLSLAACTLSGSGMGDPRPAAEPNETTGPGESEPTGSTIPESTESTLSGEILLPLPQEPTELYFSSGAGGWYTSLLLYPDGSFTGSHHDSDMGIVSDAYPYGTAYICNFSGKFENITKINDYSYSMTLTQLETDRPEAEEWIEDGIRYIQSYAYGLDGGTEFVFYLPQAPLSELSEDFRMWWPLRFDWDVTYETLSCYAIRNVAKDYGFFTWD